jgi:aminoglycoside 6'-N-acetyltransferase
VEPGRVRLRPLAADELPLVAHWLSAPHVARWYLAGSSVERELDDLRKSVAGSSVHVLAVLEGDEPIGWCQWYPCAVDPEWATDMGAAPGDVGIDYAIGEPSWVGRGVGTALVGALVDAARAAHPGCAVTADPDQRNVASRRVLEKNGFRLLDVTALASERTADPVAIYRLAGPDSDDGST